MNNKENNDKIFYLIDDFAAKKARNSIAIAGPRGSGKTYLLKSIQEYINKKYSSTLFPIYISGYDVSGPNHFYNQILNNVRDIVSIKELGREHIISSDIDNLINNIFVKSQKRIVLLIDEFEQISHYKENLINSLRKSYQKSEGLLLIIAVEEQKLERVLSYKDAFYGQLIIYRLNYPPKGQIIKMLCSKYHMGKELAEMIYELSDHNLNIVHSFGALYNENLDESSGFIDSIKKCWGFTTYFINIILRDLSPQQQAITRYFLRNLNREYLTPNEIAKEIKTEPKNVITQLSRLIEKDIVYKEDRGKYSIRQIYKEWAKAISNKYENKFNTTNM